jgi:hypothetical protein
MVPGSVVEDFLHKMKVARSHRALGWLALVVVLVLTTRAIVYGMDPTPTQAPRSFGDGLDGPGFGVTALVAIGLGALLSAGLVWVATLGVRERWELAEDRPDGPPPVIALARVGLRALALTLAGWLTFAALESAIHLQAGLGFHGLDCLVGPVHRNALPVVAGLALVASALLSAAGLVRAWRRRTVSHIQAPRPSARPCFTRTSFAVLSWERRPPLLLDAPSRGPPLPTR